MNACKKFFIAVLLLFASVSFAQKVTNPEFIELNKMNPAILLDIRYATANNFTGKVVYPEARAFLVKDAALSLDSVQKELEKSGLGLKIYDGYRPLSVQKKFWEIMPDERYVADPKKGSRHNRGMAVDLTLVDKNGKELSMPTEYDDFTEKAHRDYMSLTEEQIKNRKILEDVMTKYGFTGLPTEWWHFDYKGWENFDVLDVDFKDIK
ncbi:MAG: D-alanyl-D-alanine dipeptidase [Bacteroidetes bacterium]|mgnify:CR=1 FL=1|nr:D-alanyl-D-alanine dipeptidase [Bacteroidota bacterium]